MKRTFIAIKIPVSDQVAGFITAIQKQLKNERIKWVDTLNMHITLFFLGDTTEKDIHNICMDLDDKLKGLKQFELVCKGIGVFRNIDNPSVLWFGIERHDELLSLKIIIDNVVARYGYKIDQREFKPHLTLGRIKYIKHKENLRLILDKYHNDKIESFNICELIFYESILMPTGPVYKVIRKFLFD